jgi:drug/metabolite transporter (DMT)-like permease
MSTPDSPAGGRKHTAGAYDVRIFIAGLIGFYGVVLVILGLFADTDDDRAKTGDVNANLWAGIVMVVVALAFFAWTRWRPIVVDEAALAAAKADIDRTAHH